MNQFRKGLFASLALALVVAAGCGGGGGGSTTGTRSSTVNLFVTDNLVAGYDHVWVTVYKVELVSPTGNKVVFDDATGHQVDLRSLRDDVGRRFRFLGRRAIESGNYTGIQVTLGEGVSIFPTGVTAATSATFEGSAGGRKVLSVALPSSGTVTSGAPVILDFDLPNWNLSGTTVSATDGAYLKFVPNDPTIHNVDRHDRDDYHGTISGLAGTAPDQTFTMTLGPNTVTVKTDLNTILFNGSGTTSPALADGQHVEVSGVYSSADSSILATRIKIEDETEPSDASHVKGKVTAFDAASNSVTITLLRSEGFQPTTTTITLSYADTAKFFGVRGKLLTVSEFEALLSNTLYLEAEGTLSGEAFTAVKLKVEGGDDHGGQNGGGHEVGEAEAKGLPTTINAADTTFTLKVREWEGLNTGPDHTLQVKVAPNATVTVNGTASTVTDLFTALTTTTTVKVKGSFDASSRILTAADVTVGSNGGGGGDGGGHN